MLSWSDPAFPQVIESDFSQDQEERSSAEDESAGELAGRKDSVSAGQECFTKLNDLRVAKAMTRAENPLIRAAQIQGCEALSRFEN